MLATAIKFKRPLLQQLSCAIIVGTIACAQVFAKTPPHKPLPAKIRSTTSKPPIQSDPQRKARNRATLKRVLFHINAKLEKVEAEHEQLKSDFHNLLKTTQVNFTDRVYAQGGVNLVLPRSATFPSNTGSGLGLLAGAGKHFGRNHVAEINLLIDYYTAVELRYRYNLYMSPTGVSFGPLIGARSKILDFAIQSFVIDPALIETFFIEAGFFLGASLTTDMLMYLDFTYMIKTQQSLIAGAHLMILF